MKITKEMFWNLPQLSRIEYMLVKKELRDRSQIGVTLEMVKYFMITLGFMILISFIAVLIDKELSWKIFLITKNVVYAFTLGIILGMILDIFLLFRETKKHKEIDARFFNEKK